MAEDERENGDGSQINRKIDEAIKVGDDEEEEEEEEEPNYRGIRAMPYIIGNYNLLFFNLIGSKIMKIAVFRS